MFHPLRFRAVKLRPALLALASCLACQSLQAGAQTESLLDVARLWRDVRYIHPALANGAAHWEQALAQQLPAMAAARDEDELEQSVRHLLRALNDPSVRVWSDWHPELVEWDEGQPLLEWVRPGTALLHLHAGRAITDSAWRAALSTLHSDQPRKLIVDLRDAGHDHVDMSRRLKQLAAACITTPLLLPAEQYRFSAASRPYEEWDGPDIHGGLMTLETERIDPAPAARRIPVVFLVNALHPVPAAALALQRLGQARIVAEEGAQRSYAGPFAVRRLGQKTWVGFAAGQLVYPDGVAAYAPDLVLKPEPVTGPASAAVRAAGKILAQPWKRRAVRRAPQLLPVAETADTYGGARMPTPGWRMLAAVKLWAIIDRQHPARHLLGASWDAALAEGLKNTRQAETELQYGQALQMMAARAGDGHTGIWSRALTAQRGQANPGVRLSLVEGKIIVTGIAGTAPGIQQALAVGDEILAVDGRDAAISMMDLQATLSASTQADATRSALDRLLSGPDGKAVTLTIASPQGHRVVALPRRVVEDELPERHGAGIVRKLEEKIAYVDLNQLERDAVPAMFDAIAGTDGVIFDLRGYPRSTVWTIAPRLNVNGALTGPIIHAPFFSGYPHDSTRRLSYAQKLGPAWGPLYRGKVVVLVDDRTKSQGEHTVLQFAAAAPITLVGSATSGTNGDIRQIRLPGKVTVSYSGYEITHADGARLQRAGLRPHIIALPTVAGIRAHRDEVLERAVKFLHEGN